MIWKEILRVHIIVNAWKTLIALGFDRWISQLYGSLVLVEG